MKPRKRQFCVVLLRYQMQSIMLYPGIEQGGGGDFHFRYDSHTISKQFPIGWHPLDLTRTFIHFLILFPNGIITKQGVS